MRISICAGSASAESYRAPESQARGPPIRFCRLHCSREGAVHSSRATREWQSSLWSSSFAVSDGHGGHFAKLPPNISSRQIRFTCRHTSSSQVVLLSTHTSYTMVRVHQSLLLRKRYSPPQPHRPHPPLLCQDVLTRSPRGARPEAPAPPPIGQHNRRPYSRHSRRAPS